ncbi:hypothetical protein AX16_003171 [Volvariella volvacea WC 439]|nr:hypothetical protein AX16_003171 [Volvariella volvacea WC 439]
MSDKKKSRTQKAKAPATGQQTLLSLFSRVKDPSQRLSVLDAGLEGQNGVPRLGIATLPFANALTPRGDLQNTATEIIEISDDELGTSNPPSSPATGTDDTDDPNSICNEENPGLIDPALPPIKVAAPKLKDTPKSMYSIFVQRPSRSLLDCPGQSRKLDAPYPPYPNKESQHVKGLQTEFSDMKLGMSHPSRNRKRQRSYPPQPINTLSQFNPLPISTHVPPPHLTTRVLDKHLYLSTIPEGHLNSHPAIRHIVDTTRANHEVTVSDNRLWVDKWHPSKASHVLGNEANALYLRDWMQALRLNPIVINRVSTSKQDKQASASQKRKDYECPRGVKRSHIIRSTSTQKSRKKRRIDDSDEEDGWLDEDFLSPPPWGLSEDDEPIPPSPAEPHLQALGAQAFNHHLANTIVLVGPHGCGKTASVFACAEELGWEVFEVYPGIGRRNGANIDHLVGDVGKNHIMKNTRSRMNEPSISRMQPNAFTMECDGAVEALEPQGDPVATRQEGKGPLSGEQTSPGVERSDGFPESQRLIQQSLILLEEVDILFKEDVNFWPAVIDFIRSCKRPVICTCNDISLIPLDDLPLQAVLTYQPCPSPVAVSYLQAICCAEGAAMERNSLVELYDSTYEVMSIDLPEASGVSANGKLPVADLRRAIHSLQLWCVDASCLVRAGSGTEWKPSHDVVTSKGGDWHLVDEKVEQTGQGSSSALSAHLTRDPVYSPQGLVLQQITTADDEIGHLMLEYPATTREEGTFGLHDRDEEIASFAIRLARGMVERGVARGQPMLLADKDPSFRPRALFRARVDHKRRTEQSLRGRLPLGMRGMGHPAIALDYQPWFRLMVEADDRAEKEHLEQAQHERRGGRTTRNSQRYERVMESTSTPVPAMPDRLDNHHPSPSSGHPSPPHISPSLKDPASRHSPITDLAPLEFLQSQRRGSITDPSLHVVSANPIPKLSATYRPQTDSLSAPLGTSTLLHEPATKGLSTDPRPTSPYIFTEPPSHPAESNAQIRKLLHSPTHETPSTRHPSPQSDELRRPSERTSSASETAPPGRIEEGHKMVVDSDIQDGTALRRLRETQPFDYNMRRHSIAAGQDPYQPSSPHGLKRKMSADRGVFPPVGEEIDPQLIGPGVPSSMDLDSEGPAPKRRGSAIDTQRIAQLSLNDRRNSTDFRGPPPWILNGRRDSAATLFPNVAAVGGYNSAFTGGESPHARPPPGIATFAWPPNSRPPDHPTAATMQNEGDLSTNVHNNSRTFDPNHPNSIMIPPLNYPPDRRLSVPDALTNPPPSRVLRSRSRPPSRQPQNQEPNPQPSATPSSQDDVPPPTAPSVVVPPTSTAKKEGSTPYSRSPELRVSHKLAERKRRKEMKDLFDELRDQLPADRGMKASKWEILSKAIDFITQLKQSHQDMAREIDMLRHELDSYRQGALPPFASAPPHPVVYGQGPVPYAPGPLPPHPTSQAAPSRPNSTQNGFPPGGGPPASSAPPPAQNGSINRVDPPS